MPSFSAARMSIGFEFATVVGTQSLRAAHEKPHRQDCLCYLPLRFDQLLLQALGFVMGRERVHDRPQLAFHHLIELVQRQTDAMIRHAILRKIVGADFLRSVAGLIWSRRSAAMASCCLFCSISYRRARNTRMALARFLICDFSSCCETTSPLGMCVMRTAE